MNSLTFLSEPSCELKIKYLEFVHPENYTLWICIEDDVLVVIKSLAILRVEEGLVFHVVTKC